MPGVLPSRRARLAHAILGAVGEEGAGVLWSARRDGECTQSAEDGQSALSAPGCHELCLSGLRACDRAVFLDRSAVQREVCDERRAGRSQSGWATRRVGALYQRCRSCRRAGTLSAFALDISFWESDVRVLSQARRSASSSARPWALQSCQVWVHLHRPQLHASGACNHERDGDASPSQAEINGGEQPECCSSCAGSSSRTASGGSSHACGHSSSRSVGGWWVREWRESGSWIVCYHSWPCGRAWKKEGSQWWWQGYRSGRQGQWRQRREEAWQIPGGRLSCDSHCCVIAACYTCACQRQWRQVSLTTWSTSWVITRFYVNELLVPLLMQGEPKRRLLQHLVPLFTSVVANFPVDMCPSFYVNELLVPLLMQGEPKRRLLQHLVPLFTSVVANFPVDMCPILVAARNSVATCFKAVWALLDPCAEDADIKCLDQVSESREGVESYLKQTLAQSQTYKVLQQELRSREVAHAEFGPVLKKAMEDVTAAVNNQKVTLEFLEPFFQDLPQWRAALRVGCTSQFEDLLLKACDMLKVTWRAYPDKLEAIALVVAGAISKGLPQAAVALCK